MHEFEPDVKLLERWQGRRDAEAFGLLIQRYGSFVYSACLRVLQNAASAEEAAQECFTELLSTRARIRSLPSWLHQVATRRALDRLRAERARKAREHRYAQAQAPATEPEWDEISPLIDEAIAALPEKERHPILLRYFEGRSLSEISRDTAVPIPTLQYRLNKGVERIRKHLVRHGVAVSAGALGVALASVPVHALPGTVAGKLGATILSAGSVAGAGAGSVSLSAASLIMGGIAVKKIFIVAGLILLGAVTLTPFLRERTEETAPAVEPASQTTSAEGADLSPALPPDPALRPEALAKGAALAAPQAISNGQAIVEGMVVDEAGAPVPDALVELLGADDQSDLMKSGSPGDFRFAFPEQSVPKQITLRASLEDRKSFNRNFEMTSSGLSGLRLVLKPTANVAGRVIDSEGSPLENWRIDFEHEEFPEVARSTADGSFSAALATGVEYEIRATGKNYESIQERPKLALRPGQAVTNLELVWDRGVTLSGYVRGEDGEPVADATIGIGFLRYTETGEHLEGVTASSGTDGSYEVSGIPALEQVKDVSINHEAYRTYNQASIDATKVRHDFTLTKRPTISGRILDAKTKQPVTSFRIFGWIGEDDEKLALALASRFPMEEKPDGSYTVQPDGHGLINISVSAPGYFAGNKQVGDVAAGESIENTDIYLDAARPLRGIVVDDSGAPVSEARIYLERNFANSRGQGVARSGEDGLFEIEEYPASLTLLSATKEGFAQGWTEIKSIQDEHRITLGAGGTVSVTLHFGETTLGKESSAFVGIFVEDTPLVIGFPAENGSYLMKRVPAGEAVLRAGFEEGDTHHYVMRTLSVKHGQTLEETITFSDSNDSFIEGRLLVNEHPPVRAGLLATIKAANGDTLSHETATRPDGSFFLGPVPAQTMEFGVRSLQMPDGSNLGPAIETITTNPGETTRHDILLSTE